MKLTEPASTESGIARHFLLIPLANSGERKQKIITDSTVFTIGRRRKCTTAASFPALCSHELL
jgi:hypothetical protein